ncbi:unnamed protein product, partial [Symbiodinium necroappetens]
AHESLDAEVVEKIDDALDIVKVGYHPDLSLLAAHIMAVTGNEKASFQALVTVYRKYHLEGYLQGDTTQEALGQDAAKIWDAAHVNFTIWPMRLSRL